MAYTMDDFIRDTDELVLEAPIKRDPDAILERFDPEQQLKGLDPDVIEAWLAKQRRERGH